MSSPTPGIGPHSGPYESQAIPTSRDEPGDDAHRRTKGPSWQAPPRSPPIDGNSRRVLDGPVPRLPGQDPVQWPQARPAVRAPRPPRREAGGVRRRVGRLVRRLEADHPHPRARALVERHAPVANWKLKRAVRVEDGPARRGGRAEDVAHEVETKQARRRRGGMHMLQNLPAEATYRLRSHICGMEKLVELWQAAGPGRGDRAGRRGRTTTTACWRCWATRPARSRRGRAARAGGHRPGSSASPARPGGARPGTEAAVSRRPRHSFILLRWPHDRAGGPAPKPSEVTAARSRLRGFCGERAEEFRAMRGEVRGL